MTRDEKLFLAGMRAGATLRIEGLSDSVVLSMARREFDRAMELTAPPEVTIVEHLREEAPKRGRPRREQ